MDRLPLVSIVGLVAPELKARGLDAFSRTNPPMAKGTTLPD